MGVAVTLEEYVRFWQEGGNAEHGGSVFVFKSSEEDGTITIEVVPQIVLNADSNLGYRRFSLSGNKMVMIDG